MDWDEFTDQCLHVALSASGLVWISAYPDSWWAYAFAAAWFSFWREDAQHRKEEGWHWLLEGEGGRWMDIGFGTLGGVGVGLIAAFT